MYLQLYRTVCGQCVYPATGKQSGKSYWPVEKTRFHVPRRRSASHVATNKKREKCTLIHLPDILKLLKQNLNGLQRILRSSLKEKRPSRDRKSPKEHKHEINIHFGPHWSPRRIAGHWSDSSMNSFFVLFYDDSMSSLLRRIVKGLARQFRSTLKWKLEKQYFWDKPLMSFQFFWCIWDFLILLNIGKDGFEENVHKIYNLCQDRQRRGSLDCWRLDQCSKVAKTFWKMPNENWKPSQQHLSLIWMTIKMLSYVWIPNMTSRRPIGNGEFSSCRGQNW